MLRQKLYTYYKDNGLLDKQLSKKSPKMFGGHPKNPRHELMCSPKISFLWLTRPPKYGLWNFIHPNVKIFFISVAMQPNVSFISEQHFHVKTESGRFGPIY